MEGKRLTMLDLLVETHIGLERQGPGSPEATTRALSFVENPGAIRRTADLGCGTGGQTMMLAQHLRGTLVGLDQFSAFIDGFNANAEKQQLQNRVTGLVGSMEDLPFAEGSLDLVWSEGAIDNIGFEKGLTYWNAFLKKDGYVAVTCPSWFTDERPAEVEKLWSEAGSRLDAIADNIAAMQRGWAMSRPQRLCCRRCAGPNTISDRGRLRDRRCAKNIPVTRPWRSSWR